MCPGLARVADPPDVVAGAVGFLINDLRLLAREFLSVTSQMTIRSTSSSATSSSLRS